MKKILFITTVCATQRAFLLPYAKYYRELGWHVDGMAEGISNCFDCNKTFNSVIDIEFSRNPFNFNNLLAIGQIKEIIESERYDIVHVHTPVASFLSRYAISKIKSCQPKVIYTAHGFHFHPRGKWITNCIFINLEKLAARWTDRLLVINKDDYEICIKKRVYPPEKTTYIPGIGINLNEYNPQDIREIAKKSLRESFRISEDSCIFIMIAEFNKNKDHTTIIKAFSKITSSNVHLLLAGVGKIEEEIRRLAKDLNIENRVHFLGFRKDIKELISISSALLLTSYREGLPRSIMEALCMGIPVIGSNIRGITDLVSNDCGLLIEPGNESDVQSAMEWILRNPDCARRMGSLGKEKMKKFDINRLIQLNIEIYEEVLNEKKIQPCIQKAI